MIDENPQPPVETRSGDILTKGSPATVAKPPRVWTVFVAVCTALVVAILFQTAVVVALSAVEISRGVEPAELSEVIVDRLTSPYVMITTILLAQLAIGIVGFLAAILSPEPFHQRVALSRARPSWRVYPMVMLGSIFPLAIGLASAEAVAKFIPADEGLIKFFEALTIDSAIVFVLFVGIAPGFFEEFLFRGYMQQRLVQRWGVATGIVVTSIIFGLFHVTPHAIAAAMPLAFWLGYVAWRSQSIWPAILCHFFVNSGLNAWRMIIKFGEPSETAQNTFHVVAFLIGLACFAICCWPAFWREPPDSTE